MKSKRLVYKQIRSNDVENLHNIFGNEKLTRYFTSGPDKNMNETSGRISKILKHWELYDFGDFLIFDKVTNVLIGFGGLHYKIKGGNVNIAYVVIEEYQSKGYGHEISNCLMNYGFKNINLNEIVAEIDPENEMSKLLIEKCGFEFNSTIEYEGFSRDEYLLNREIYLQL